MNDQHASERTYVTVALHAWTTWLDRATKLFDSLSETEMRTDIVPGKNRPIYLFGHLVAVNDSMIPQLRLGEAAYPALRETFVVQPDRAVDDLPSVADLRSMWIETNARLTTHFQKLSPTEWLERHATVSEADFVREPNRNRLAILLSRTSHISYHIGQLMFLAKLP